MMKIPSTIKMKKFLKFLFCVILIAISIGLLFVGNGYKMYQSINDLKPYLSKPKKYFYEWQKRFFRALSWKIKG